MPGLPSFRRILAVRVACLGLGVGLAFASCPIEPAAAREIEGYAFPEDATAGGQPVKLVGVGLRTKWMTNVYVLGAYQKTPKKSAGHLVDSDEPKQLWLHMMRGIGGDKMRDAIDDGIASNTSEAERAPLQADVDKLKAVFPNAIAKGLDIVFVYQPGRGTTLKLGGAEKLTVAGRPFMRAIWNIWFGRSPADKDLKNGVLGG